MKGNKVKYKYTVDTFCWIPKKDHSGNDKCYTDEYSIKRYLVYVFALSNP